MRIGSNYKYNKVIQININNYNTKISKEDYMMRNKEGIEFIKEFKIININLPNIRKKMYNNGKLNEQEDEMIRNLDMKDLREETELRTAKLLKKNNVSIDTILKCTGLTKSQIMNL